MGVPSCPFDPVVHGSTIIFKEDEFEKKKRNTIV